MGDFVGKIIVFIYGLLSVGYELISKNHWKMERHGTRETLQRRKLYITLQQNKNGWHENIVLLKRIKYNNSDQTEHKQKERKSKSYMSRHISNTRDYMEYREMKLKVALSAILFMGFSYNACAQTEESHSSSLNVEMGIGFGTQKNGDVPFGGNIDCNYNFNRFSIHAVANADYFHPKNGKTSDFNRSRNLGGGIGYVLFPKDDTDLGTFEFRALVTTSVGSSNYNNTDYKFGIYWYGNGKERKVRPVVSAGYTLKDFRSKDMPSYQGAYISFGFRL